MSDNFDEEGFSKVPLVPTGTASLTEDIIVHHEPRISANKLAEYVVADPSRQKTILKDAKFAKKVVIVGYKGARGCVPYAFSENSLNIDVLVERAKKIEAENDAPGISDWQRSDNANSAAALKHLAVIAPELSWGKAKMLYIKLGGLEIAGVKVSIQPELVFGFEHRNIAKVGAVILNTAKGDDKALDRGNGAHRVGDYLSSLVFQVLLAKASKFGAPLNSKCYAVDVFREKVYTAPMSYRKLNKNLEAACEMIASRWKDINPPA
jgi:hypothetical protein